MTNAQMSQDNQSYTDADSREFLSFVLGEEHYALDIMSVKEIQGHESVTKIANAPAFIKGVNDIMSEITAASAEQATGIDEVGKGQSHHSNG
jgi:purine-binding chemotaxis protein CheW